MTRETKIGLLVGLAFIIVIGILLSDHVTTSAEPPQAPLSNAGSSVRDSTKTPSSNNPPITQAPAPGEAVMPQQPVMTQGDIAPRPQPVQIVEVGPNAPQDQNAVAVGPSNTGTHPNPPLTPPDPTVSYTPAPTPTDTHAAAPTPIPTQSDPIAILAEQNGEPIVPTGSDPRAPGNPTGPRMREYIALPGDTLSKLAGRFMGGNTRSNRQAIINANPSLKEKPDLIVAGRMYLIPVVSADDAATASATTPPTAPATVAPQTPTQTNPQPATPPRSEAAANTYVTKQGDTLWGIAAAQMGDGKLWTMIRDLNKDVLKNSEMIHPGMTLRLPPKGIASVD